MTRSVYIINYPPITTTLVRLSLPWYVWRLYGSLPAVASSSAGAAPVLFRTHITDHAADDVVALDSASQQMVVIGHPDHLEADVLFSQAERLSRPYVGGSPIPALAARGSVHAPRLRTT